MVKDENDQPSEVEKSINAWRQSERKVMIDTVQDLIQTSHKYAKSQYTPSAQRVRWTKLAGQLIWYKDQILKSFSLEALTIQMMELKKMIVESDRQRERDSRTRNNPMIGFSTPVDRKPEDAEETEKAEDRVTSDPIEADESEGAKEIVSSAAD
jgi:hypothetical protein